MSDPVVEPGPSAPKDVAPPSKGAISKDVSIQKNLVSLATEADSLIIRLNKLIASPGGVSALLSTSNYALYLIAHLQTKAPSLSHLSQLFLHTLNYKRALPPSKPPPPTPSTIAAVSPILALASLISKTRSNLRLLGLPSLYAALRALLSTRLTSTDDALSHRLSLVSCLGYFAFQLLENVYVLVEAGVLPASLLARVFRDGKGAKMDAGKVILWSCRAWLVGVVGELLRVGRGAVLAQRRRKAEGGGKGEGEEDARADVERLRVQVEEDARLWREAIVPLSWLPVAVHYSLEGGLPGMNLGVMGFCGMIAGLGKTQALWKATKG
ncbi:MAG: hypothetical protein M1821_002381 [Bathelium mastoideum]|nr:MAG: hypothetical protein M1821_002381 [Bathelium mastoideum]KAI9686409.1 MAG: hypothetical protein M1822_003754 [Bathelium mastoideum]